MKNSKIFSSAIAMLFCIIAFAQEKTITGIVSDKLGPLPGANVVVKGTTRGTQTDFDGKYSIKAKEGETLDFSYIGMKSKQVKIAKKTIINVQLDENGVSLDEVVVVAYGTTKKEIYTGSVSNVQSNEVEYKGKSIKDVNAKPIQSIQNKLMGTTAGVSVSHNSNNIVIRGASSPTSNTNPLYIVDGITVHGDDFKKLDPNSIATVNVLKDSSAASLYGSRASNGVVEIKTKNGLTKEQIETFKKNYTNPVDVLPVIDENEDYEAFVENAFESPKSSPLSTFSIDVDNASYTNIRRFINNGQSVPKDAVRVEEMMNFFKYNYPEPKGEHPFSINTEYSDCPWNSSSKLVKIGLQGKTINDEKLPASNLVFLIDVSGSMNQPNKLPLLKQSFKVLVNQLRPEDKVSIVVYAGAAGLVLPPTSGDKKMTIIDALDKLNAGGSTAGGAGIQLAYKTAKEQFIKNGNNRVVLATDGDFNVGASSDNDMQRLIEEERKSGVFLTCLGFGMGNYKDSKMETLANKGNGNYSYIDNIQEANRFLGKEFKGSMFAIAKDVKIQIEFNPAHVQAYRLIGYENRKLRPEDFKNDAIDAGELGSGHTVTALYEIIPVNTKSDLFTPTDELKYTKTEPSATNLGAELATIKFRYKKPDGEKSIEMIEVINNKTVTLNNASADFKFCASVAWFGLKLRDSKLVTNKTTADIKKLAQTNITNDTEGYKAEFIRLIEAVN